jgi:hypothetical protein
MAGGAGLQRSRLAKENVKLTAGRAREKLGITCDQAGALYAHAASPGRGRAADGCVGLVREFCVLAP